MTRILAVLDPEEDRQTALARCTELPPESDLDIHVAIFIEGEQAETFAKTYQEKSDWLQQQVAPYIADGYKITTEIVAFKSLYESVIETAVKTSADIIIKHMRQHSLFSTVFRTSTDWNLIRHCPIPLLLTSNLESVHKKPVLAAVDVCSGEENHDRLNEIVLENANNIAGIIEGKATMANAFRAATPLMAVGSLDATPYPTPRDLENEHVVVAGELAQRYNIAQEDIVIEEGSPSFVINKVANEIGAAVIVIGTVARTGISGALIGNSAEGVLEATDVDIMVVKLQEDTWPD